MRTHCGKIKKIGNLRPDGYLRAKYSGKNYYIHRLAYRLMTGADPRYIDHINGNRSDNRWLNLREVSKMQNRHNSKTPLTNKTGVKGVSIQGDGYRAEVVSGGRKYRKYFSNLDAAALWVKQARGRAHGTYTNHGGK
jgi:hypothetical protein